MSLIRMSGGQSFQVVESYEDMSRVVASRWDGTVVVTDASTAVTFTIAVPQVVSVQP